ncbi:MAG: hypothetical protein J0L64_13960 [Acidobacteria bacterium]|nr:hypothetical protein [Acidobacteriota bacterium]
MRALRVLAATLILIPVAAAQPQPPRGNSTAQAPRTSPAARTAPAAADELQKAVEEFRVQATRLGLTEGPATAQRRDTKGKSRWHGRLFENLRNDFLDAVPHEVAQRGGSKNILRRNQFGFNVSGPVLIPKLYDGGRATFFTFTYEGMREKIGRSSLRTIATTAERTGDWSATVDSAGAALPIYDPQTTAPNPGYDPGQDVSTSNLEYNRVPFAGNVIPASRLDRAAQSAMALYPTPNSDAGPFFRNNYFVFTPEINSANGIIARVDHTAGERHRIGSGVNFSNGQDGASPLFLNEANPGAPVRSRRNRRAFVEHIFTLSPQRINTFTVDAYSSQLENLPEAGSESVFPAYLFSPYLGMGRSTTVLKNARNQFIVSNGHSIRWKQHRVRLNGRFIREQVNIYAPAYPEGMFRFGAGLTSLPGINNTGHAFASFLLGQAEYAEKSVVLSPSYFRRSRFNFGFADTWEIRKGLVFSVSVGLEVSEPRKEKYDRQSTVSFAALNPANNRPGALIVAGVNGQGRAFQPFVTRGEPSAGLTWNPFGAAKTVVRLGYGRSYSAIPIYSVQWGTQAFNGSPTWVAANPQLQPALTLAQGLPESPRTFPDLRPDSANNTVADLIEPRGIQPTYQSFSLSFERELPGAFLFTLGLGHAGGRNLLLGSGSSNPNAIPLSALEYGVQLNDENFNRSVRPFPQYQRFDVYASWPEGRYQRDACSLRVEKRASSGLALSASYEFSKQMDNYSGPYGIQDYYNRANEKAITAGSNPHAFTVTYSYELPMGPNRLLFPLTDWRRYLVEGWSLSGVTTIVSGEPLALRPQFNNTGRVVDTLHVNVVPGADPHVSSRSPELWFNPAAFAQPADFTLGDASRTHPTLRGPGAQNHDLSVNKRISLSLEKSVEFSMVGLNFVNHANWSDPDTMIGPASAPNVNAGRIIGSRGGRVIQLGLRFSF